MICLLTDMRPQDVVLVSEGACSLFEIIVVVEEE